MSSQAPGQLQQPAPAEPPEHPAGADPSGDLDPLGGDTQPNQRHLGAAEAVEALAETTLAPVASLRRGHWTHRAAVLVHLSGGIAGGVAAWRLGLTDWGVYLTGGLCASVLVANSLRWKRRWGWLRRGAQTTVAVAVTLAWGALLFDRAQASVRASGDPSASAWFWIPTAALALAVPLLVAQYIVRTRRDRALRKR